MNNRVSIRRVLDDIMVHPLMRDITLETAVRYTVDFMRIMGCYFMFEDKFETIDIKDYRGVLPCDFYEMRQVKDEKTNECYRYATGTFHNDMSHDHMPDRSRHEHKDDLAYKIQGNAIFTSVKDTKIRIAYQAISVDDDGYPTLPDNSVFLNALELYIKRQWFTILFDMAKIPLNVYQNAQQEYAWAAGQCHVEGDRLSIDRMESLSNSLNTMLVRANEHGRGFETLGTQERVKVH